MNGAGLRGSPRDADSDLEHALHVLAGAIHEPDLDDHAPASFRPFAQSGPTVYGFILRSREAHGPLAGRLVPVHA
jgi:hypothetical protein